MRGGEVVLVPNLFSPVDVLQHVLLINAEDVGDSSALQDKDFLGFEEPYRRLCCHNERNEDDKRNCAQRQGNGFHR
jgi:hypothetical protein